MVKEKIKVCVRIRPLNPKEALDDPEVIHTENNVIKMNIKEIKKTNQSSSVNKVIDRQRNFEFENVFNQKTKTIQIYESVIHDIAMKSIRGINSTVFVYGQTGGGKTFTMTGNYFGTEGLHSDQTRKNISKSPIRSMKTFNKSRTPNKSRGFNKSKTPNKRRMRPTTPDLMMKKTNLPKQEGLLMMALKGIFKEIKDNQENNEEFSVRVSYIEIYNESVYDLLRNFRTHGEKPLQIFEDVSKGDFYVKNSKEEEVSSFEECFEILVRGEQNRHFAATRLNHNSSRSHVLFRIFVTYIDDNGQVYESVCNFVDLAGSEKLSKYQDENNKIKSERIQESKSINKSLFFLTQIINFKSSMKDSFVPYRNSPLTKILKSSIGGNAKTAIILCVNPSLNNIEQTLGTLKFGNLASKIENVVSKNTVSSGDHEAKLNNMMKGYEKKMKELEDKMANDDKSGNYLQRIKELEQQKIQMQQKYANLMKLSKKAKFGLTEKDIATIHRLSAHFKSCGVVDYYHVDEEGILDKRGKRKLKNPNFFRKNRTYTKEIFEKDVHQQKRKKIDELEQKMKKLNGDYEALKETNKKTTKERDLCLRLLRLLLNQNPEDHIYFNSDYQNQLIDNSLNLIGNCKSELVNSKLRDNSLPDQQLLYEGNENPSFNVHELIDKFNGLIQENEGEDAQLDTTYTTLEKPRVVVKKSSSSLNNRLSPKNTKKKDGVRISTKYLLRE